MTLQQKQKLGHIYLMKCSLIGVHTIKKNIFESFLQDRTMTQDLKTPTSQTSSQQVAEGVFLCTCLLITELALSYTSMVFCNNFSCRSVPKHIARRFHWPCWDKSQLANQPHIWTCTSKPFLIKGGRARSAKVSCLKKAKLKQTHHHGQCAADSVVKTSSRN